MAKYFQAVLQWRKIITLAMLCAALLHGVDGQWTLQNFAQEFCDAVAQNQGASCSCVDINIVPGQGSNPLCGYSQALGPGLNLGTTTLTGWSSAPSPSSAILLQSTCDARNSQTNSLQCTQSGVQAVTASTTTTITVGTGFTVGLNFPLDEGSAQFSFTFEAAESTSQGNTVSATSTCGPGGTGQPAETCQVYTESYLSYTVPGGTGFNYDAVVNGGVQMSFDRPVDALGAVRHEGDGSKHYYWYFPVDMIVSFGQRTNLANYNQFDSPDPNSSGNPVTFHGSGLLSGQFLDVSTDCTTSACS